MNRAGKALDYVLTDAIERFAGSELGSRFPTIQDARAEIRAMAVERLDLNGKGLQVRGLGDLVREVRAGIATIRDNTRGLGEDARALNQSLTAVRKQINDAHEDLKFEAQTLGNSPPSDDTSEKPADADKAATVEKSTGV